MEVLFSLLVDPGEFCSPWLCFQWSWSPPSPLGLWSFSLVLFLYFFLVCFMAEKLIKRCLLGRFSSSVFDVPRQIYSLLPVSIRHAPLYWVPKLLPVQLPPTTAVSDLLARRMTCTRQGGFLLGTRVWATFCLPGRVRCCPMASFCKDVSGDGAGPPRAIFPTTEFLPNGGSVVLVFYVMFVYSRVYFHNLSM